MKDLVVLTLKVTAMQIVLGLLVAAIVLPIAYFFAMKKLEKVCSDILKAMAELEGKKR